MRRVALVVGLVLTLAGCGGISDLAGMSWDVQDAGYEVVAIQHTVENDQAVLNIEAEQPGGVPTEEDAETIAKIGWETANGDIDRMSVVINGQPLLTEDAAELTTRLGERPPESARNPGDSGDNTALIVVLVISGAFVFVGATVLLYLRSRRRRPPQMYSQPPPQWLG